MIILYFVCGTGWVSSFHFTDLVLLLTLFFVVVICESTRNEREKKNEKSLRSNGVKCAFCYVSIFGWVGLNKWRFIGLLFNLPKKITFWQFWFINMPTEIDHISGHKLIGYENSSRNQSARLEPFVNECIFFFVHGNFIANIQYCVN